MRRALLALLAHPDDESYGTGGTLARYAAEGVEVHVAIATDGAAGSVAKGFEDAREQLAEIRAGELERATRLLGATLHRLGYRDSGMSGADSNNHPQALIQADVAEATGRVVALIRAIRPQVVITHDETGGYYHPDHIFCWRITTAAFHAAADPGQYAGLGLPPYQAQRLYYIAFSNRWTRIVSRLVRLRGADPRRMGRNQDIDLTRLGLPPKKIHAYINYRRYWDAKKAASAAHGSQGGGTGFSRLMPEVVGKLILSTETYQRAFPPVPDGFRERDLFQGIA